mmetsp:Transcript_7098/g.12989  ORF Transcript_7098/g.12989 Transcript_7098/m.12989 type:complete len:521 (+) Transcript_7098:33-1595(+)
MGEPLIQNEDLTLIASLYDRIRKLYKDTRLNKDASLTEAFEKVIRKTVGDLSQLLKDESKADTVPIHVISSKFALHQFCGNQFAGYLELKDVKASNLLKDILGHQAACFKDLVSMSLGLKAEFNQSEGKKQALEHEIEAVLQAAEELEQATLSAQHERDEAKAELLAYKEESGNQVLALQQENQQYLEKIIKLSKQSAANAISPSISAKPSTPTKSFNFIKLSIPQQPSIKELTLRQLKEMIDEIYASKKKFDAKCIELQQTRETMEQHMITFFNQKYGLKNLTQEWCASVFKAVAKFEGDDSEVSTFGHILRHEVDEEFRLVQDQVKQSVSELLRQQIKTKYPYMGEAQVKGTLHEKLGGDLFEEDWVNVLRYMYNENDVEYLHGLLTELKNSKPLPKRRKREDPVVEPELSFGEFLKVVLDFQLIGHSQFLGPFREKFRQVDADGDGVITEAQFAELISLCNLDEFSSRLLEQIDPFELGQFTFSDCIGLLSAEQVEVSGEKISMLQRVFLEGTQIKD